MEGVENETLFIQCTYYLNGASKNCTTLIEAEQNLTTSTEPRIMFDFFKISSINSNHKNGSSFYCNLNK